MSDLYSADRVAKISHICRKFATAVRVGDEIELGLLGDPEYPELYKKNRPKGIVTKVKGVGTDAASIRVRLTTGKLVDIMPHTLDPRRVWEFSDEHFSKVVARTRGENPNANDKPVDYGRVAKPAPVKDAVDKGTYSALVSKVDQLAARLSEEITESRSFNGALVATFNEMSKEIAKVSPDSQFCRTFASEYESMAEKASVPKQSSPFDSDFSDSD